MSVVLCKAHAEALSRTERRPKGRSWRRDPGGRIGHPSWDAVAKLQGAATAETASTSAIHQLRFSAYLQSLAAKHMR